MLSIFQNSLNCKKQKEDKCDNTEDDVTKDTMEFEFIRNFLVNSKCLHLEYIY